MEPETIAALSADYIAASEDLEHVVACCDHLLVMYAEPDGDKHLARALWQSGLISLRRTAVHAQSMSGSGAANNPFRRQDVAIALPQELAQRYRELLNFADKVVAHRTPVVAHRDIQVLRSPGSTDNFQPSLDTSRLTIAEGQPNRVTWRVL